VDLFIFSLVAAALVLGRRSAPAAFGTFRWSPQPS
jgi:hypothetical protein